MFIKWRTYQRQLLGKKGDKYIQQPIIVKSFRVGKKRMKEISPNMPIEAFDMPEIKKKILQPRQQVICKLPSFPRCMVHYFRSPHWMMERYRWWEGVDLILAKLAEKREDMTEQTIKKLKVDLEEVVPRVTPEELAKLEVVLNDLPLHL